MWTKPNRAGRLGCIAVLVWIGVLAAWSLADAQEITPPDYFPMLPGTVWTHLQNGVITFTTRVLNKTVAIKGVETVVFRDSQGMKEYYSNDGEGIRLHRQFAPNVFIQGLGRVNLSVTFVPPLLMSESTAQIGQSFTSSGFAKTNSLPRVGVLTAPYSSNFTLEAFDRVTVPAGTFDVVRLVGTLTLSGESEQQTFYLAETIGIVKSVVGDDYTIELVSTNAETHDFAVTNITAPKLVTLTGKSPAKTFPVKVKIQNRSPHPEIVQDLAMLGDLVRLSIESLGALPECSAPTPVLRSGPPQKAFPIRINSKGLLTVYFDVTIDCANDPAMTTPKNPGHSDYSYSSTVNHAALDGREDIHFEDDTCPRSVTPPFELDPSPDETIKDKGCGQKKQDGTFGADILTDVVIKK